MEEPRDNGGPFSEAKLLDIAAILIFSMQDVTAKEAYERASLLIKEKRGK